MMSAELDRRKSQTVDVSLDDLPTLQLEDIAEESESALVARGAAYAKEYAEIQGKATTLLKNIAVTQVALRVKYDDMAGRSGPYRAVISAMYDDLRMPEERVVQMQATIRYHVGNIIRRHMTPRELEAAGLRPETPIERQRDDRAAKALVIQAYRASAAVEESTPPPSRSRKKAADAESDQPAGHVVKATADHLRLAEVALNMLGKFDRNVIKTHMTGGQRAKLDKELRDMERKIAGLRKLTQKPSSKG
ncbi:hypothetical protein [Streptomyces californicus]|uniref:hypothetical protein n=1 Tax=Streptomyces californicus TaxID=67351 RepID=UPI0004BFDD17|nr:hypothetical protein [Streptomyces californicus]QRV53496.1 hypothetical protein I6J40_04250 [Streptomyces californicus]